MQLVFHEMDPNRSRGDYWFTGFFFCRGEYIRIQTHVCIPSRQIPVKAIIA